MKDDNLFHNKNRLALTANLSMSLLKVSHRLHTSHLWHRLDQQVSQSTKPTRCIRFLHSPAKSKRSNKCMSNSCVSWTPLVTRPFIHLPTLCPSLSCAKTMHTTVCVSTGWHSTCDSWCQHQSCFYIYFSLLSMLYVGRYRGAIAGWGGGKYGYHQLFMQC